MKCRVLEIVLLGSDKSDPSINADDYPEAFDEQELFRRIQPMNTKVCLMSLHARTANI